MKSKFINAYAIALLPLWMAVFSHAADEHQEQPAAQSSEQMHHGRGVVEAVNAGKGIVTLDHEAIKSLRWPKMVMDFKVQDPALLKGLKEGDQIEFDLVKMGKQYHITRIAPVR
jgi:Cu/Ag efflux protein CusF